MRYVLLICSDDKNAPAPPKAEMEAIVQGHGRFATELQAATSHARRSRAANATRTKGLAKVSEVPKSSILVGTSRRGPPNSMWGPCRNM